MLDSKADIIRKYGEVCKASSCTSCPLGVFGVSCQDACAEFSGEVVSILEAFNGLDTYLAEYRRRFPFNKAKDEDIIYSLCRKEIFEGAVGMQVSCPSKDCNSCWLAKRVDDVEDEGDYTL
jgi:hypothetical protein